MTRSRTGRRAPVWIALATVVWASAIGYGWWTLAVYEFQHVPADFAAAAAQWPAESELPRPADRPTVLFFMHPKCPCTRASLAELERLWVQRDCRDPEIQPRLFALAAVPSGASDDWLATDILQRVKSLPDAELVVDDGGREAKRFGAVTSGTVMWFGADGRCLYSGGITPSRGHEGGNVGRDAIAGLLRGGHRQATRLPPFGCPLCSPGASRGSALP